MAAFASIPMKTVGPMKIIGPELNENLSVPLATFESPLWPSVSRGAKISQHCQGITVIVTGDKMTRSIALDCQSATQAHQLAQILPARLGDMQAIVNKTSRFAQLINVYPKQLSRTLYLRLAYTTGDASGHNMTTLASDQLMAWLLNEYPDLRYSSISANLCIDKKTSAINSLLGRGKSVIAEMHIPRKLCQRFLKATPEILAELHTKKNLQGSILSGSLCSANAHYANMLLAFYLATGQDAANIVEGSQGITTCDILGEDLLFSVNLPNIIVGSIGNGKTQDFVKDNLALLGCDQTREPGANARRLAAIAAATVLCGELSLMGALANPGELIQSHIRIERNC